MLFRILFSLHLWEWFQIPPSLRSRLGPTEPEPDETGTVDSQDPDLSPGVSVRPDDFWVAPEWRRWVSIGFWIGDLQGVGTTETGHREPIKRLRVLDTGAIWPSHHSWRPLVSVTLVACGPPVKRPPRRSIHHSPTHCPLLGPTSPSYLSVSCSSVRPSERPYHRRLELPRQERKWRRRGERNLFGSGFTQTGPSNVHCGLPGRSTHRNAPVIHSGTVLVKRRNKRESTPSFRRGRSKR